LIQIEPVNVSLNDNKDALADSGSSPIEELQENLDDVESSENNSSRSSSTLSGDEGGNDTEYEEIKQEAESMLAEIQREATKSSERKQKEKDRKTR